jgi:hypothetical protein
LRTKAHSLVDDVVCQGVCYRFELGAGEDGRHTATLIRPAEAGSPTLGGSYGSMAAMAARAPADLLRQGVPPAVVAYVVDSLSLFLAYR